MKEEYKGLSVSENSLKDSDLIINFSDFLFDEDREKLKRFYNEFPELEHLGDGDGVERFCTQAAVSDVGYAVELLIELINELAPEGYYFGIHEGNGSDFGFWEDIEY